MKKALYALPLVYVLATPAFAQGLTQEQQQRCTDNAGYITRTFEKATTALEGMARKFFKKKLGASVDLKGGGKTTIVYYDPKGKLNDIAGCVMDKVNKKGNGVYWIQKMREKEYKVETITGPGV